MYQYDADFIELDVPVISYVDNTLTYLTQDLNDGDTVVYLNDVSNWYDNGNPNTLGLIFWNYKNSLGYTYPELTYSRNVYYNLYDFSSVNKSNNTITLKEPWNHGKIEKNTKLSRSQANSGSYSYGLLNGNLTSDYIKYSNTIIGRKSGQTFSQYLSQATEYIKFYTINNFNNTPSTKTYYKNIVIREVEE